MKKKLLASLIAVSVLAGCSSSGSGSSDENTDPGYTDPKYGIENPIEKDDSPAWGIPTDDAPDMGINHIAIADDGSIVINGDKVGTVDKSNGLVWKDGVLVGSVTVDKTDRTFTYNDHSSNNTYAFTVNNGIVAIDWEKSSVDNGWGVTKPKPELPPTDDAPDMGINHIAIADDGSIIINGDNVGIVDKSNGLVWKDGVLVGSVTVDKTDRTLTYNDHSSNNTYAFTVSNGVVAIDWEKSSIDNDWGISKQPRLSADQKSQIRTKAKDLRENIKAQINRS
ncbi:hypothetical protein L4D77_06380 [Photobacterium frigidiphilum]|uniref:hypothetical protein n=1 Tax=Photobacterium frigidiphilum TaxID=264736 RepID=UPI003D0C45AB